MPLAIFGIDNTGINLGITFVILALFAIWIALIVFTFSDAKRRISDPFLVACATAASFFPFVGTIVYTILRPPELLEDVKERETEMKASETRIRHLEAHSCRKCGFPTGPDYVRCPACRSRLKEACPSCERPVGLKWKVCPYCEHTLIAPKRSRSASKDSAEKSPESGRRRSGRNGPVASEGETRVEAAEPEAGDPGSGRRSRRGRSEQDGRPERREPSDAPSATTETDPSGSADRPRRDATRSGRPRTVITDDGESMPGRTINGGDSDPAGRRPDSD